MMMRFSSRLFLWEYCALLLISHFLLIVYGNCHPGDDESRRAPGEIEEHRRATLYSQQPTCNPVFKRFLAKLLKEIQKLGLPSAVTSEMHYDAEVKLSKLMVAEIQKIVNDENSWRTGALDDALSQILINFKLHDPEAWKWRFEDTFGVELDTVFKVCVIVLIVVLIICIEMWSMVSWFVHFVRLFGVSLVISLVWNWVYLYKMTLAEYHANMVKLESIKEKCTGMREYNWIDNFKEWFRTTLTLQDDPCETYYRVLMVHPILRVPPTKAVTMTLTSFITDPLKHLGQGISEFLRALLKDLPVTLQIPVLILIALAILLFIYIIAQALVQHAILSRDRHQASPPSIAQQPAPQHVQEEPETHRIGEEHETSASNTKIKDTQLAEQEHDAKSHAEDAKDKSSGHTSGTKVGDSASEGGDASKNEDCVESIGTLAQETLQ